MALAFPDRSDPNRSEPGGRGRDAGEDVFDVRLSDILAAAAEREPQRLAFADQPDRERWSGRPRIAWTCANSHHIVERLAAFLRRLGLPPASPVAIGLPNGSEASIALLAVERAGHVPCLVPAAFDAEATALALKAVGAVAAISQGVIAEERPAETFRRLAADLPLLRHLCAFGPQLPEGTIDLDRAILDTPLEEAPPLPEDRGGIVTFEIRRGEPVPLFRPFASVLAAAADFLAAEPVLPGERICSLLAPDDHASLTTGLVAALLSGVTLDLIGLPDTASLTRALSTPGRTHVVAPAFLEPALAEAMPQDAEVGVVLVHRAPLRPRAKGEFAHRVIDVVAFGETACLSRPRGRGGRFTLSLADAPPTSLLAVRCDADGGIAFRGAAAAVQPYRGLAEEMRPAAASDWRASGFKAEVFAGVVIGIKAES